MRLLFRLLLVVPVLFACEPRTQPSAPTFEASIPKPLAETADEALGTRDYKTRSSTQQLLTAVKR